MAVGDASRDALPAGALIGFLGAVCYGMALSAAFKLGYDDVAGYLFLGLFVCAVLFRLYRVEYVLGFVSGLIVVFGAVLPSIIALVFVALSALVHLLIRPMVSRVWVRLRQA
jgi:hypothetical protein